MSSRNPHSLNRLLCTHGMPEGVSDVFDEDVTEGRESSTQDDSTVQCRCSTADPAHVWLVLGKSKDKRSVERRDDCFPMFGEVADLGPPAVEKAEGWRKW